MRSYISEGEHLNIGAIIFPGLDQTDFTASLEVLSRLPNSTFHILWTERCSFGKTSQYESGQTHYEGFRRVGTKKIIRI